MVVEESILRGAGHQVVTFIDGDALEEKVTTERPDLLLPQTRSTPVVLVSSKNEESDRAWGRRQGADDDLGKPFTSDQLLGMVGRFAC
jgi:twitching motility two-component system response regulator PilH